MRESFLEKLKRVRWKDLGHIVLFALALLPAWIYRRRRPHLWLICENENEARDNGYWFFRYLRESQPQVDAVYAINRHAEEYAKVRDLGETVQYGSFRHWICYLAAEVNISSQKNGKPNAAVCYLLEVTLGWLKNRRVFLQHGVIKDDLPFLHYENAKLAMFSCSAEPEYCFVRDTFGYPEGVVQHVGLCRFDALHECNTDPELVLIIPTWRMWLERNRGPEAEKMFLQSDYYKAWSGLINSAQFSALLERYNKRAVFCLHRNMGAYEHLFHTQTPRITVLRWQDVHISELLREAGTMITDFSSVYMDFAYMKKPLVYFQFDQDAFRQGHLPVGYFDYERDGFGPVCKEEPELLYHLEKMFRNECRMDEKYRHRVSDFYTLHDRKNCERTYLAVRELLNNSCDDAKNDK